MKADNDLEATLLDNWQACEVAIQTSQFTERKFDAKSER